MRCYMGNTQSTVWQLVRNIRKVFAQNKQRNQFPSDSNSAGVSNLLASLGHAGRKIVLGHTLNTQTLTNTDEQKKKKIRE